MKYFPLVWSALMRRPVRTLLTMLSVTCAFVLFGTLHGIDSAIDSIVSTLQPNHLRVVSNAGPTTSLPVSHLAKIAALPGVVSTAGFSALVGSYRSPADVEVVLCFDLQTLFGIYTDWQISHGELEAAVRQRSGAIIGRALAEKHGWKIGDRVPLRSLFLAQANGSLNWTFDIVGIYDSIPARSATQFLCNYDYLNQSRASGKDTIDQILVKISDSSQSAQISQAIDGMFINSDHGTKTRNERELVQSMIRQIGNISAVLNSIIAAVLFTLLFLSATMIAESVRERIGELAVLQAVGFSNTAIQWLVFVEAVLPMLVAAVLGLAIAVKVLPLVTHHLPLLGLTVVQMPAYVLAEGVVLALAIAVIGGAWPAWMARRTQIVDALAMV